MKIRSFIAVDLPDEVLARLVRFIDRTSKGTKGFSWVTGEKIHLTLRFLGAIEETVLKSVSERLNPVVSAQTPLALQVRGVGFFPSVQRPRIVWAGLEGEIDTLRLLQGKIEAVLEGLEVHPREDREFKAHLTLARVKDFRTATGVARILQSTKEAEFGDFVVNSLFLYKSDLTPKGSRYTKLDEFHLTGDTFNGNQS